MQQGLEAAVAALVLAQAEAAVVVVVRVAQAGRPRLWCSHNLQVGAVGERANKDASICLMYSFEHPPVDVHMQRASVIPSRPFSMCAR